MVAMIKEAQIERLGDSLRHLHDLLPLKERQHSLVKEHRDVHQAILRSLVERGRPLDRLEIAEMLSVSEHGAASVIALLGSYDLIVRNELTVTDARTGKDVVLDAMGGDVVGAYPVTTEETVHRVTVNGHRIYAMCAVDALAVGPMFNVDTLIESECAVTGEPVRLRQRGAEVSDASPAAEGLRVGVRWQRPTTCAAHVLCRQMVFLRDPDVARDWQASDPVTKELFTLPEAIAFGDAFFRPLMDT
jgi:mercuric reductase